MDVIIDMYFMFFICISFYFLRCMLKCIKVQPGDLQDVGDEGLDLRGGGG